MFSQRNGAWDKKQIRFVDFYPAICVSLSKGDMKSFDRILEESGALIREQNASPAQSKNNLTGLIHTMEVYAQSCGLTSRDSAASMTERYSALVMKSGYMEDAKGYLKGYFLNLHGLLKESPGRNRARAFQEPIVEYIKNHCGEKITLNEMARMTGYSTYYFTRLFKKSFECTMTEYLTRFRIERNKEILVQDAWWCWRNSRTVRL